MATSASRGTFSSVSVSSVSRLAIIRGRAAFLAPEMAIEPFRRLPPTMRMRSMSPPPIRESDDRAASIPAVRGSSGRMRPTQGRRPEGPDLPGKSSVSGAFPRSGSSAGRPREAALRRRRLARSATARRCSRVPGPSREGLRSVMGVFLAPRHDCRKCSRTLEPPPPLWQLSAARAAPGCRSSVVEHPLGKGEVVSSILTGSTITP